MSTALTVAIVGSGPSGFYAAKALLKQSDVLVEICMFDKLPTPFGLVRSGVAPDHQSIKGVVRMYEKIASAENFTFFGNVRIGVDVTAAQLRERFDVVIWAVGNENARSLGIPGESLEGVYSATEFVFWYNGHPEYQSRTFDFSQVSHAVVVGNGNVSMDVTRILCRNPSELQETDISLEAMTALEQSSIEKVSVLARRGVAQAAFSPKEIKEIIELDGVQVTVSKEDASLEAVSLDWLASGQASRNAQKNIDALNECVARPEREGEKTVACRFKTSPIAFLGEEGKLSGVRMRRNRIEMVNGALKPVGTAEEWEEKVQVVFQAIGYRGVPVPGVSFDERRGIIPNDQGRVLTEADGNTCVGEYVVGWAKRGPSGLIGTNGPDSRATVDKIIEDHQLGRLSLKGNEAALFWLRDLGVKPTTYEDWKHLDELELKRGEALGKVRLKYTDVSMMLSELNHEGR